MTIASQNKNDEISFKEIVLKIIEWYRYLLSNWVLILSFGILGGALGFLYAHYNKPVYTATTTFVLEEEKSGSGGLGSLMGLASMAGVDIGSNGGGIFQGDNILELYKSRTMIEKTLLTEVEYNGKKQLLIDRYIEFNNLKEEWAKKPELKALVFSTLDLKGSTSNSDPHINFTRLQDSIMGVIVKDIDKKYLFVTKEDKKLSIIKADVKAKDEFFAKAFNEAIVKNVNDFYVQTKTKKSLDNIEILQQKTDSVRMVMNGAIYSAAAIADATPNLNSTRQVQRTAPVQRSQFSAETNKSILSLLIQNLEMAKISLRKETPLIQVIDEPVFPLEKNKFGKLKGIVMGGIFAGFIICLALLIKNFFKTILTLTK